MMDLKLQMIKLRVFRGTIAHATRPFTGYGVEITFGYENGVVDFSIPPIYETQDEALTLARAVRDLIHSADPEQVYIVQGFDGVSERVEFKRNKN